MSSSGAVPDGGVTTGETPAATEGRLESLGPYRWVVWFVVLEAVLLGIAIGVDRGLGAPIVGGLLAAFAVLIAAGGGLGALALVGYRAVGR